MRHRKGWFSLILLVLGVSAASACSNQGEGQRCDKNSGDSDCASGLVCKTIPGSMAGSLPESVCCPLNQSATTTACSAVASEFFDASPAETADANGAGGARDAAAGADGSKERDAATGGARAVDASIDGSP
ncbi:MAG TPA: hypothetical protein VHC69_14175 [Polyangiaceae bacterium]|nr:hypothetical protein [Polyangiaceae bacterium]